LMLLPLAMIVGMAGASQAANSELERELQRELHRMPPPTLLPTPATLACYERLGKISRFAPLPIQSEPAQCATIDLVRLERVTMPDQTQVAINPPAVLLCSMAEAVAQWVRDDVGPAAAGLGAPLAAITDLDSYECRSRNRIAGAKLSEHGKGNALEALLKRLAPGGHLVLGDDENDRSMFRVASRQLIPHLCVGVGSAEVPPDLFDHCDLVLDGPAEASAFLRSVAEWATIARGAKP